MRLMQNKREAYWFYRFLSIFYDKLVNPLFWTEPMRDASLQLAELDDDPDLTVIDVGSGTGFTTEGIVQYVPAERVTCVDQSPHQQAKAKQKTELQGCRFVIGDAENIPAETDAYDRYVSAGSIEYWPNPQRGITEAYRVIKPGGKALLIGPLEPGNAFSRWVANTWMLFPPETDYHRWYKQAGFTDIRSIYVRPHWVRKDNYGIAIVGAKPAPGLSPLSEEAIVAEATPVERPSAWMPARVLLGSLAGFIFIPMALIGYLWAAVDPPRPGERYPLNRQQKTALIVILVAIVAIVWLAVS